MFLDQLVGAAHYKILDDVIDTGDEFVFSTSDHFDLTSIDRISDTEAVIVYRTNSGASTHIAGIIITESGSTFTAGAETEVWDQGNYTHDYLDVATYDDSNFVVVIKSHSGGGYSNEIVAIHCSMVGSAITVESGSPTIVDTSDIAAYPANCGLTATHGILAYQNFTDSDGKAACLYL